MGPPQTYLRMNSSFQHVVASGWNLFGACPILAIYFSSVPTDFGKNPGIIYHALVGVAIIAAFHAAWFFTPRSLFARISVILGSWHLFSSVIAEMGLFFILCQPVSRIRSSAMHIPSEFSYIPILFSACFVVPCIYGKSKSPAKSVTVGCFILFKSFLCFTTIVAVDPCSPNLSCRLGSPWNFLIFFFLVATYSMPIAPISSHLKEAPKDLPIILGICKSLALVGGMALFSAKAYSSCSSGWDLLSNTSSCHDFHSLRTISQYVLGSSSVPGFAGSMWGGGKLLLGIFLKLSPTLSTCWWFIHAWSYVDLGRNIDAHEIKVAVVLTCMLLSTFSVSRQYEKAEGASIFSREHSVGMLASQGILWTIILSSSILILISRI